MKYLSDSEYKDLEDFAFIANCLLGCKYSKSKIMLMNLKISFGVFGNDDCAWFLKQVKRLKDKALREQQAQEGIHE